MSNEYLATGRSKQKQKTRYKILASAQKYLGQGQDFTLEDVAQEAGVSRATVYRYYSSVEVLSVEAGLDLNIDSPETIVENFKGLPIEEQILGIQDYINRFTIANEATFRKFISVVLTSESPESKRGARRARALRLALQNAEVGLSPLETEKFIHIATLMMGMEALIVSKDVCRLSNEAALESLQWGLKMILKGIFLNTES